MKYFIGIDPGKTGAIVVLDADNNVISKDVIPLIGKEVDINELSKIILLLTLRNCHVILEDVHSIFGASAKSNFSFGHTNGVIEGVLVSHSIAYTKIQPKTWQKEMWQGIKEIKKTSTKKNKKGEPVEGRTDTKATSLLAAKRLFPKESFLATERSKVAHDGIVDAILLAEYCRRKFN